MLAKDQEAWDFHAISNHPDCAKDPCWEAEMPWRRRHWSSCEEGEALFWDAFTHWTYLINSYYLGGREMHRAQQTDMVPTLIYCVSRQNTGKQWATAILCNTCHRRMPGDLGVTRMQSGIQRIFPEEVIPTEFKGANIQRLKNSPGRRNVPEWITWSKGVLCYCDLARTPFLVCYLIFKWLVQWLVEYCWHLD